MVCLDTSFLIDLLKGKEEVRILKEEIDKNNYPVTIASPSIIELIKGLKIGKVKEDEEEKINNLIFSLIVLNLDRDSAILSGEIESELIKKGELIDLEDIMIAAITITNNERLITKNEKHFSKIKNLEFEIY